MAADLSMPILVVDDYSTMIRIICYLPSSSAIRTSTMPMTARPRSPRSGPSVTGISDWNLELMTENVIAAKRAGVSNYIVKPFNAQTLQAKTAAAFAESSPPPPAA